MKSWTETLNIILNNTKEQITVKKIVEDLSNNYNVRVEPFSNKDGNYLILMCDKFDIAITVCSTDKHKVIKLEDFIINENYRGKGLGTKVIKEIMEISKSNNCILGLWCEKNNVAALEFYNKLGFIHVDTRRDYWLEY